jgi:hypothetical protein
MKTLIATVIPVFVIMAGSLALDAIFGTKTTTASLALMVAIYAVVVANDRENA